MTNPRRVLMIPTGPISWNTPRLRAYWVAEVWEQAEVWDGTRYDSWNDLLEGIEVLVIQQKMWKEELEPLYSMARERQLPIIWDTCDPIWWWSEAGREIAKRADFIVASNDGLAALARQELNKPSICIPDRHKISAYAVKEHRETDCPVLLWHGWRATHASLWNCSAELARLHAMGTRFKVVIVDNTGEIVPEAFTTWNWAREIDIELVKWEYPRFFQEQLQMGDIGLVPPYPGVWSKYKSNNKEAAFWVAGIPTVDGTNLDEMSHLMANWELRRELGKRCREAAIRDWSIERSVEEWRRLIEVIT